jgi:acyl carrier protein
MTGSSTAADELVAFIERDLLRASGATIDIDTYLFAEGGIDSLKILRLIAFVECATNRRIPESDVVMANFRSVRAIVGHFWPSADDQQ